MRTMAVPSALASARTAVALETLAVLAVACRNYERIAFRYTDREGVTTEREVEPHRIVLVEDRWYLVAFDSDRHDWRTFRIDRMDDMRELGRRFHPRDLPAGDAAAFVRAGLREAPARHSVEADVELPADEVTARIGRWATAVPWGQRRCRVTIAADSPDWAIFALGILGADFELLGPPEVAQRMREWSERFAAGLSRGRPSR
jgi:predicted DNA-binding transcriptional regulator YafY